MERFIRGKKGLGDYGLLGADCTFLFGIYMKAGQLEERFTRLAKQSKRDLLYYFYKNILVAVKLPDDIKINAEC